MKPGGLLLYPALRRQKQNGRMSPHGSVSIRRLVATRLSSPTHQPLTAALPYTPRCVLTRHLSEGLQFYAVVVIADYDTIAPLQAHLETITDNADLQGVHDTER